MNKEIMYNACTDNPDDRDYNYSELLWSGALEEYEKIDFPNIKIFNQWMKYITRMACSRCWIWHIINAQELINNWVESLDIEEFWLRYLKINPNAEKEWATLQSALQQAKDEWLIWWYYRVNTIEEINNALDKWFFIYTWSSNWDWDSVAKDKIYKLRTDSQIVWHAWVIPKKETLLNSYWPNNGYSTISEDLYNTTFTKYAILPKEDYNLTLIYKNKIMNEIKLEMAKQFVAREWKYTNWERPNDPITRQEFWATMERVLKNNWLK